MRKMIETSELSNRKNSLRCFVCDKRADFGTPGWDRDYARDLCPKHRKSRPQGIVTLGEMIAAKRAAAR